MWSLSLCNLKKKLLYERKLQIFNFILVLWSFCEYTVSLLDLEWRILRFCWRRGSFSFCLGDKQRIIICTKALIFKILPRPDQLFSTIWPLIFWFHSFFCYFSLQNHQFMTCFSFLATVFLFYFFFLRDLPALQSFEILPDFRIFYFIYYWLLPVFLMCLIELFFDNFFLLFFYV